MACENVKRHKTNGHAMSVTYSKSVAQRQKVARDLETVRHCQSFDDANADAGADTDKIFRTSKAQGLSLPKNKAQCLQGASVLTATCMVFRT